MRRASEFVTRGTPKRAKASGETADVASAPEDYLPPGAELPPGRLPRDFGMGGRVGAFEETPLAASAEAAVRALEAVFPDGALHQGVRAALDRVLPPQLAQRVEVHAIARRMVVLGVPRLAAFDFARQWVPPLRRALKPLLGRAEVRVDTID